MNINFSTKHKSLQTILDMGYGEQLLKLCIKIDAWGSSNVQRKGSKGKQRNRYVYKHPSAYNYEDAAGGWLDYSAAIQVVRVLFYSEDERYHLPENCEILRLYQHQHKNRGITKEFVEDLAIRELLKTVVIASDEQLDALEADIFTYIV